MSAHHDDPDASMVAAAAARVRKALGKVVVLEPEDGSALAPNQLLHQLQESDAEVIVAVWRGPDGVWLTDWSACKPGELLEAATALKLDAEVAWCEIQEQAEDEAG